MTKTIGTSSHRFQRHITCQTTLFCPAYILSYHTICATQMLLSVPSSTLLHVQFKSQGANRLLLLCIDPRHIHTSKVSLSDSQKSNVRAQLLIQAVRVQQHCRRCCWCCSKGLSHSHFYQSSNPSFLARNSASCR